VWPWAIAQKIDWVSPKKRAGDRKGKAKPRAAVEEQAARDLESEREVEGVAEGARTAEARGGVEWSEQVSGDGGENKSSEVGEFGYAKRA
jgi:hypothetical protein